MRLWAFNWTSLTQTIDVFGEIVDAYTMNESVKDETTVRIVWRKSRLIEQ
jgi:type I restriction enzyme R subunit